MSISLPITPTPGLINVDAATTIQEYLDRSDWRVNANANQGYSLGGLILNTQGKMTANYWLSCIYTPEIGEAHRDGSYHIHDLDVFGGYCAGWSLKELLNEGFNGVPGRIESNPPKHFSSAVGQIVNFMGSMQNEWAGAQAFSSFDTYMAPFVRLDSMTYEQVKQNIQELIYNLNVPSRWGNQSPFTNLTFDLSCPDDVSFLNPLIGGEECDFTYGELQEEMDMINRAYIEVMTEGDARGRVFTFPIPTYNITEDFEWDSEISNLLFEMTAKYGLPYFQNFLNSELNPGDVRSMCPLTQDTRVIVRSKQNGVRIAPISDIVAGMKTKDTKYEVWTPKGWVDAKPVQVAMTDVYEITLSNGTTVRMGENHLQPTKDDGVVSAKDLTTNTWLPFNKQEIISSSVGTFDLGYIVGAYFGDGSRNGNTIIYSLNKDTDIETSIRLITVWESLGFKTSTRVEDRVQFLVVKGDAYSFISRYVAGTDALSKSMTSAVFDTSIDFRYGLIAGYRATDGSKLKKRIYTSSAAMAESLIELFGSLGEKARIGFIDRREGRLGTNDNYRVDFTTRTRYSGYFDEDEDFNYYKVTGIKNIGKLPNQHLYCFEIDTDAHVFTLANGLVTHNCRLQLDLRELLKRGNGLFGSAEKTGSIGVVTINMARLGYQFKGNKHDLIVRLNRLLELAKDSLETKRVVVQHYLDNGLFPYSKRYLGNLNSHFSTIGVNGMNEMVRNFSNGEYDLTDPRGNDLVIEILDHIRGKMVEFQEDTGNMYNLEATPAEGTTYRFAREDRARYPSIIQAGSPEQPYYTNSSQLPVGFTDDPFEALERQEVLQKKYTGGTVLHLYLPERLSSGAVCKTLVRRSLENFSLPYITITPTFSICNDHGYLSGEHFFCPECGKECEVWTRIMGYFRPVSSFNVGKKGEYAERVSFEAEKV